MSSSAYCRLVCLILLCCGPCHAAWQAGLGRVDITPREPVPLAGYGGKTRLSQGVDHPIWLKALALRDERGQTLLWIGSDLVGLSQRMVERITADALAKHGLKREQLLLNCSHNHSCPVTEDVLWLYYEMTPEEKEATQRYTQQVYLAYQEVIAAALKDLRAAEVFFEQGLAGVAVNRRRSRGPESRAFGGQVDQDVPVLAIKSDGRLRGFFFGYSCHTTALGGLSINGDYAGYAMERLERDQPGVLAGFIQNCGGDANPLPRLRGRDREAKALAQGYGDILAEAVRQVLEGPMKPLQGELRLSYGQIDLPLEPGLSQQEIESRLPKLSGMPRREFQHFLSQYQRLGRLPDAVPYPIQVARLGSDLLLIALTGETVVDYSLQFKAALGWNQTWVSGYNNDLTSYIPSLRVLREGGYEGLTGMYEYGHRAAYSPQVEELIHREVQRQVKALRHP